MTDKPEIVDAEFEVVSGPDAGGYAARKARAAAMTEADIQKLAEAMREKGIGERELRQVFTESGHPDFLPGGRHYQPPSIWRRLSWLKWAPAFLIVVLGGLAIVTSGKAYDPAVRFLCDHGLKCPANAPAYQSGSGLRKGPPSGVQRGEDGAFYAEDPVFSGRYQRVRQAPDGDWYLRSDNGSFYRMTD